MPTGSSVTVEDPLAINDERSIEKSCNQNKSSFDGMTFGQRFSDQSCFRLMAIWQVDLRREKNFPIVPNAKSR